MTMGRPDTADRTDESDGRREMIWRCMQRSGHGCLTRGV